MKYILIETFFGYLFRPILLWNIQDILTVLLEIAVIWLWWGNVKSFIKSVKKRVKGEKTKDVNKTRNRRKDK
ncbi:MAG: hypothetical protein U0O04_03680 [Clostridia bacterium]|jgi:hypothetical protein